MINTSIEIKLYSLNELPDKAKQKAIDDHRNFELSVMCPSDFISGEAEYDTEEELQKMYEKQYDYYLCNDEPIIENIEANDYLYFENGEQARTIQYCGNHPRTGQLVFIYNGQEYILKT